VRKGEFEILGKELLNVGPLNVIGLLEFDDFEDVDRPETGSMSGSHILVKSFNSIRS